MGVPLTGPTYIYGDNMLFIYNTSRPESTLKKKSNSICYHVVREAVASGECLTTHCKTGDNYSDMMTKVLYGKKKWDNVAFILYDIWDHEDGPETTKGWLLCMNLWHDKDHSGICLHVFCINYPYDTTKTMNTPVCMYFYVCKINIHKGWRPWGDW